MKNKSLLIALSLVMLISVFLPQSITSVEARSYTSYNFAPAGCVKFSKKGKTLTVKFDDYHMFNNYGENIKKKKFKFKLSKKCKWYRIDLPSEEEEMKGVKAKKSKVSYKKIKKAIKADRKYFLKHRDGNIQNTDIVVKKGKVIKVVYYYQFSKHYQS